MKFEVENFGDFLNTYAKPAAGFVSATSIAGVAVKLICTKKEIILYCVGQDRDVTMAIDGKPESEGEVLVLATSILGLRSNHKEATISVKDKKLCIVAKTKGRNLEVKIESISGKQYNLSPPKIKKSIFTSIPTDSLQASLSKINISPITTPGVDKAILCIMPSKKELSIIIHDASRALLLVDPNTKIKSETEFVTDSKLITTVMSLMNPVADSTQLMFTKKFILAKGLDKKGNTLMKVRANHTIGSAYMADKARAIINRSSKMKTKAGFIITKDFINMLENVLSLVSSRGKEGHIDLNIKGKVITIRGTGPTTTYTESMKLEKVTGSGTVRISSKTLDLTKLISPKSLLRITDSGVILKNSWERNITTLFMLPYLSFTK